MEEVGLLYKLRRYMNCAPPPPLLTPHFSLLTFISFRLSLDLSVSYAKKIPYPAGIQRSRIGVVSHFRRSEGGQRYGGEPSRFIMSQPGRGFQI
jgi:hypothetical protein